MGLLGMAVTVKNHPLESPISLLTANIIKPEDFKRLLFFTVSVCTSEHSFSLREGLLEDIQLLPFAS